MNIDKNEELKSRIFNRVKLVCERDMGIIFPNKPSKEIEDYSEMVVEEIVAAISATFRFEA